MGPTHLRVQQHRLQQRQLPLALLLLGPCLAPAPAAAAAAGGGRLAC
jgi:hypothetical protein